MNERMQFACYIGGLREKLGITMKQLCEGLLSDRAAMMIEQGKWDTARPMREALLERLGVGAEDYECYLGCEEYAHWKAQQQILHFIAYEEMERAEDLLEKYWDTYCGGDSEEGDSGKNKRKLEQQFYFAMLAQIRRYNGVKALHGVKKLYGIKALHGVKKLHGIKTLHEIKTLHGESTFHEGNTPHGGKTLYRKVEFHEERNLHGEKEVQSGGRFQSGVNGREREILRMDVREEAAALFEKALKLTVPAWEERPISKLTLSIKELNLILEVEHCRTAGSGTCHGERPERYREVLGYITSGRLDRRGIAKIYPKAVYFLCRSLMEEYCAEDGDENARGRKKYAELLTYCNRALKILRDNGRMYFLWEILDMRGRLFKMLEETPGSRQGEGGGNLEVLRRLQEENARWKQVLEDVCAEFKVPRETFHFCYLYVSKGVSCTNDVIRIRSDMLGIKGDELCEGVCSTKTLRRIRKRAVSPQREVVEGLFDKLGLPGELVRTEIVTGVPEARELMEKVREDINKDQLTKAEYSLNRVKQLVSLDIVCNRQAVMRREILLSWAKKEIDQAEYNKKLLEALELTMPYEKFLQPGEKYLTYEEQSCIRNMMVGMDERSDEFAICIQRFEEIYQPIIDRGELENVESMYEFIMGYVRSYWGNIGDFDKTDKYNMILIEGYLRFGRVWYLHDVFYDRWWNHAERKKKGIPTNKNLKDEEELNKCILLGELVQSKDTSFYQNKLRQTEEKG